MIDSGGVFTRLESFGKSLISFRRGCLLSLVSRAFSRDVNRRARKRARGSPRGHLTLPLGEEVLLPLFKASSAMRFIACLDRPTPSQIKALNINGADKRPENCCRSRESTKNSCPRSPFPTIPPRFSSNHSATPYRLSSFSSSSALREERRSVMSLILQFVFKEALLSNSFL